MALRSPNQGKVHFRTDFEQQELKIAFNALGTEGEDAAASEQLNIK